MKLFGMTLPSIPGLGGNSNPKAAMQLLVDEVEKKLAKPVQQLEMIVDMDSEQIILSLPGTNVKEKIESSFMFMIISQAIQGALGDEIKDVQLIAIKVLYDKVKPLNVEYFYIKDNEKLKATKEL